MQNFKRPRKNKVKPKKHHYYFAFFIAFLVILISVVFYIFTSFSSIRQSIVKLEESSNVQNVYFKADKNKLFVKCENGKEIQIELEDSLRRYSPLIADFCR